MEITVWAVDSSRPKEPLLDGKGCTLAPPGEYNWTVHVRRRCGLSVKLLWPLVIIRPHCSTTYVDAAYCYKPSSVVCQSVCLPVCHTSEPCKNGWTDRDAVIVLKIRVGPQNHVLEGGPDPQWEGAILRRGRTYPGMPDDTAVSCAKMAEPIDLPFTLWPRMGRRKHKFNRPSAAAVRPYAKLLWPLVMVLWPPYGIGQAIIFLPCGFFFLYSIFFSSPNLSRRRLDVNFGPLGLRSVR